MTPVALIITLNKKKVKRFLAHTHKNIKNLLKNIVRCDIIIHGFNEPDKTNRIKRLCGVALNNLEFTESGKN